MALCSWAGDGQLPSAVDFRAIRRTLKAHQNVVGFSGTDAVHTLDGEGWIVHLKREGGGLRKDILKRDRDAGAGTDGQGALGFRRGTGTMEWEHILSVDTGHKCEQASHFTQLAGLETDFHTDFDARQEACRRCYGLVYDEVCTVCLKV